MAVEVADYVVMKSLWSERKDAAVEAAICHDDDSKRLGGVRGRALHA